MKKKMYFSEMLMKMQDNLMKIVNKKMNKLLNQDYHCYKIEDNLRAINFCISNKMLKYPHVVFAKLIWSFNKTRAIIEGV